jgi:glycosyltransferase involved in cell wall biosynthesis
MRSTSEDVLVQEVQAAISSGSIGEALDLIHIYVDQIINDVRATSKVFSSKPCDDLCRKISLALPPEFGEEDSQDPSQFSTAFILSEIIEAGGHIELLKDLIRIKSFANPCVIVTNLFSRQNHEIVEKFCEENKVKVFVVSDNNAERRLFETLTLLRKISPEKLILLNHHQDSGAIVAALSHSNCQKFFIHHADHQLCLGVTCEEFIHIDLHNMGYWECHETLGLKNNKYWPLIVKENAFNRISKEFIRSGSLLTCSSGNSRKFEVNNYRYDYFELLPKILLATHGSHVHIGQLTPEQLERLKTNFANLNIDWARFTHIPWVSSVSNELMNLGVDLYISSFPLGGGKTILEAMSIGIPLLMHENYRSRLLSGVDLAYPEAYVWRNEDELFSVLAGLNPQDLEQHSAWSYQHFLRFHSEKVLIEAITEPGLQEIHKIPTLREYHPDLLQTFLEETSLVDSKIQRLSNEIERVNSEWSIAMTVIDEIQQGVKVRDRSINELGQQMQLKDQSINELGQQMQLKDQGMNELGKQLQSKDQSINELGQQMQLKDQSINELGIKVAWAKKSLSWKFNNLLIRLKKISRLTDLKPSNSKVILKKTAEAIKLQISAVKVDSDFDENFYTAMYPDILKSGVNPLKHFLRHGKAEGRIGKAPPLDILGSFEDFNKALETVIVVSHEATITGAPVLAKNIADELRKRYNIIVILMGGGPLLDGFYQKGGIRILANGARNNELIAESMIGSLIQHRTIKFALVNTIESASILPCLASRGIPTIALIHEFASSMKHKEGFRKSCFLPEQVVFSSKITHENLIEELPELSNVPVNILAQGRSSTQINNHPNLLGGSRNQLLKFLQSKNADCKVVLGIGTIYYRKGVDLFIQCASDIKKLNPEQKFVFVWIGKNVDQELGTDYFSFLNDQIKRDHLQDTVFFFEEMADIEFAYQAADILMLTSRLDPLPNVAIDALFHGVPVLCFDKASGIVDILREEGLEDACVAPFLDVKTLAEKTSKLFNSVEYYQATKEKCQLLAQARFSMSNYVSDLEQIANTAALTKAQLLNDVVEIKNSGLFRFDFATASHWQGLSEENIIAAYVRSWRAGIDLRKPMPGFHPGIYQEKHGTRVKHGDPFADFIREGCPSGPWSTEVLSLENLMIASPPTELKVAFHIHVFYPKLFVQFLNRINANQTRPDLFISVPSVDAQTEVAGLLSKYGGIVKAIQIVPNRGRDIGPLLTLFGSELIESYDIIGHMHTKVSPHAGNDIGTVWSNFLFENLLGGQDRPIMDMILSAMSNNPELGLAFPEDPHPIGWDKNLKDAMLLAEKLKLAEPLEKNLNFPVGTMFWVRKNKLAPMVQLGLTWEDYPVEPLPIDGTMLHAIERILPSVLPEMKNLLISVPNVSR